MTKLAMELKKLSLTHIFKRHTATKYEWFESFSHLVQFSRIRPFCHRIRSVILIISVISGTIILIWRWWVIKWTSSRHGRLFRSDDYGRGDRREGFHFSSLRRAFLHRFEAWRWCDGGSWFSRKNTGQPPFGFDSCSTLRSIFPDQNGLHWSIIGLRV
jgi:hypothetical protein